MLSTEDSGKFLFMRQLGTAAQQIMCRNTLVRLEPFTDPEQLHQVFCLENFETYATVQKNKMGARTVFLANLDREGHAQVRLDYLALLKSKWAQPLKNLKLNMPPAVIAKLQKEIKSAICVGEARYSKLVVRDRMSSAPKIIPRAGSPPSDSEFLMGLFGASPSRSPTPPPARIPGKPPAWVFHPATGPPSPVIRPAKVKPLPLALPEIREIICPGPALEEDFLTMPEPSPSAELQGFRTLYPQESPVHDWDDLYSPSPSTSFSLPTPSPSRSKKSKLDEWLDKYVETVQNLHAIDVDGRLSTANLITLLHAIEMGDKLMQKFRTDIASVRILELHQAQTDSMLVTYAREIAKIREKGYEEESAWPVQSGKRKREYTRSAQLGQPPAKQHCEEEEYYSPGCVETSPYEPGKGMCDEKVQEDPPPPPPQETETTTTPDMSGGVVRALVFGVILIGLAYLMKEESAYARPLV